jgi:putative nucleotide binding protein
MKAEKKEIYAIVVDILLQGRLEDQRRGFKREPVVQAVGTGQFKLLELIPKKGADIQIHDSVYIGEKERDKVERVKRRISYADLTNTAKVELPFAIESIVTEDEARFVDFFNKAVPITPKLHMFHLLPGIGKKLMWELVEGRDKKPYESFEDIAQRIKSIPNPKKLIVGRIMEELEDPEVKYRLFTAR